MIKQVQAKIKKIDSDIESLKVEISFLEKDIEDFVKLGKDSVPLRDKRQEMKYRLTDFIDMGTHLKKALKLEDRLYRKG